MLVLVLAFGGFANAAKDRNVAETTYKYGSKCGLVDWLDDVQDLQVTFDMSKKIGNRVPKVVQIQLIQIANDPFKAFAFEKTKEFDWNLEKKELRKEAKAAVEWLRKNSEAEDVFVKSAKIHNKRYSIVVVYPGGNEYGYIFPWGSTTPVASISDTEVFCINK